MHNDAELKFLQTPAWQVLAAKNIDIHGALAEAWITNLPQILKKYEIAWDVHIISPVKDLSYNLVLLAELNKTKTPVILKASVPSQDFNSEILALQHFNGHGCIKILNLAQQDGIVLLEQAIPGTNLATLSMDGQDDQAVQICVKIIQLLHSKPIINNLEIKILANLSDGLEEFNRTISYLKINSNNISKQIVIRARDIYAELLDSTTKQNLLHGDLHHYNILASNNSSWLAIDPHGIIGDPVFEIAAFMRNPYPQILSLNDLQSILLRRMALFSELLGYDKQRIWAWSFAQTILSAGWNLVDHGSDWEQWYDIGKAILEVETKF